VGRKGDVKMKNPISKEEKLSQVLELLSDLRRFAFEAKSIDALRPIFLADLTASVGILTEVVNQMRNEP
jgi:hypothetical protein